MTNKVKQKKLYIKKVVATSVNIDKISHNDDQTKVCMKYDKISIFFPDIIKKI